MKNWILKVALNFAIKMIKKWLADNATAVTQKTFAHSALKIHADEKNSFKLDKFLEEEFRKDV